MRKLGAMTQSVGPQALDQFYDQRGARNAALTPAFSSPGEPDAPARRGIASPNFAQDIPTNYADKLTSAFQQHETQVADFLHNTLGIKRAQMRDVSLHVSRHKEESPGTSTAVTHVSYEIQVSRAPVLWGSFQAVVALNAAGDLRLYGPEDQPFSAVDPEEIALRAREVESYLMGAKGIPSAQVHIYEDAPAGLSSGPNVLSVRADVPRVRGGGARKMDVSLWIRRIYEALSAAQGPSLNWLSDYTWEVIVPDVPVAYRNRIPFPGQALMPKAARQALKGLGSARIIAYQPPVGVAPFKDALIVQSIKADDRSMLAKGNWVLYYRGAPASSGRATRPSPQDYYLVWKGAVARKLQAAAQPKQGRKTPKTGKKF